MLVRLLKRTFLTILGAIVLYFITGIVLSYIPTRPETKDCQKDHTIFVASNGIHLDYFIPVVLLDDQFLQELMTPAQTSYLSFGWGDKEFYRATPEWKDLDVRITLKAILIKTPAALHVGYAETRYTHWVRVDLCRSQFEKLMDYIRSEFYRDEQGRLVAYEGYGPDDRFFDANGHFTFFKTCNVWVNNGLKKAGVNTSVWSPFDFGILHHLKKNDRSSIIME